MITALNFLLLQVIVQMKLRPPCLPTRLRLLLLRLPDSVVGKSRLGTDDIVFQYPPGHTHTLSEVQPLRVNLCDEVIVRNWFSVPVIICDDALNGNLPKRRVSLFGFNSVAFRHFSCILNLPDYE